MTALNYTDSAVSNAVRVKDKRTTHKSKKLNNFWLKHISSPFYQKASSIRYKIEQCFGVSKLHHGFSKCRYYGEIKYAFQSLSTFAVINIRRVIKLLAKKPRLKLEFVFCFR